MDQAQQLRNVIKKQNQKAIRQTARVLTITSGKGGVGKSLVTSMLAVTMRRRGYNTAILDADITGPSIPRAFGITDPVMSDGEHMIPSSSKNGVDVVSINLMLEDETKRNGKTVFKPEYFGAFPDLQNEFVRRGYTLLFI